MGDEDGETHLEWVPDEGDEDRGEGRERDIPNPKRCPGRRERE